MSGCSITGSEDFVSVIQYYQFLLSVVQVTGSEKT